ncbi:MAG: ABC transporter ATP-binding protein [Bacteroidota bacterium]
MANPVIDISNVVKVYKGKNAAQVRALDGLSLQVNQGEIFGLLGRNGAGKTTLLRILTTLITPTSGAVRILGMDIGKDALEIRRNICVVLQENAVELFLSVSDNLDTYARFHSISAPARRRRVDQAIEQFGLGEYRNQKVIDLSGGLKRRVQVAKVFMVDKPIIFLDEATTGMDPINKRATIDAVRDQTRKGRTIFLTTHILQEAEELCDTIAIIDRGKLIKSGDIHTIKSLASSALNVTMTFETLTDELLAAFNSLSHTKLEPKNNTIQMTVTGHEAEALELIARISRTNKLLHFEASSATLEDAFFEVLAGSDGAGT